MKTVKNTTRKPLSVPLPQGKRLFLGPGKSGKVTPKAIDHKPFQALIESGDLEVVEDFSSKGKRGMNSSSSGMGGQSHSPGKNVFRSGDG